MKHDQIRNALSALKDGELDGELGEVISIHLGNCPECQKELAALERIDMMIQGMPEYAVPEGFASRVAAGVTVMQEDTPVAASVPSGFRSTLLRLAESILDLIPGRQYRKTAVLDEFDDFPPYLLSHAYFELIGQH